VSNVTRRTTLNRAALLACGALALAALSAPAGDKKDDKSAPAGAWARAEGELRIEFADKGVLKISPHNKDELILVVCEYTAGKDGLVKAKVTELSGKAKDQVKEHVPVGLEFSFRWNAKGDSATLDEVKGDNIDMLKSHLEGKYQKK
jgi:hypothetical protein